MEHNQKRFSYFVYLGIAVLYFFIFIFSRIPGLSLTLFGITPILLIPALMAGAMFFKESYALITGVYVGVLLDSTTATGFFNTATFAVIGFCAGILATHLLNKNLRAAALLTLIMSFVYYFAKWFFYILLGNEPQKMAYLFQISIPSCVYTTLYIIPFYFLFRFIYKRFSLN